MPVGDYKAGTAWLEIVPSFRGIEGAIAAEVEKAARQVDSTLAASIPDGVRNSTQGVAKEMRKLGEKSSDEFSGTFGKHVTEDLNKELEKAGEKGAMEFAGAFKKALRGRTGQAQSAIPKIEIDADTSPLDRRLAQVRKNISALDTAFINDRIGEPALFNAMSGQRRALQEIQDQSTSHQQFHNARYAKAELDQLESMVRNVRNAGLGAHGAYGGAFDTHARQTVKDVLGNLPQVNTARATGAGERELASVRDQLGKLGNVRIGVDMNLGSFLIQMAEVESRLKALGDKHIELKYDTDKALAKIGSMFDDVLPKKVEEAAVKAGDAFNQKFGESVGKASKALPDIKVGADTSDAHLQLAAVKKQMQDLGDESIGISIHEDVAILQIEDMKRRLNEVAKSDPSVQVKADVAAAVAELDTILVLAGRIDKADPKVNVKVNGKNDADDAGNSLMKLAEAAGIGGSRLAALVSVGIALGSVVVPAAAAAAVAVAGIAQAAAAAGSGVGVFALGISGVAGAVQALDKYENDQKKSAASLSKSQEQVAGAVDSVNSAERSLANTRENVAYAAKQAAQTVVDAQKGVTDAHRQATQAVKDLQQAYEDARQAEQDRALSMRSVELAQRKAVLDLADAKKKLDEIMANPRATDAEREAARIAYEQQALQIDELSVKHQRLQEEQAKAAKAGVEGSTQVVAAREKVRSANDNIQKAEERLSNAIESQQKQQREGEFQIAQAVQSVANSQRQLEKATTSAGVAGGAALDNLRWAMQQLGPAGATFAKFIFSLKQDFMDLRQTAQSSMLPGLQRAIEGLMAYMPQIKLFVGEVGAALGGIFIDLLDQLKSPTWQKFFGFIRDTAVPTLQGMWRFTSLIAQGIADLIMALSPLNRQMGAGILGMAEAFAAWASTISLTSGYQRFLEYVARVGPQVVHLLGQVAEFIGRLVVAAAPMGEKVLNALVSIFEWLNSLPIERLTTIVTVLGAFYGTMLLIGGVGKVLSVLKLAFENFGRGQEKVWGGLKGLAADYRTELERLNGTATKVNGLSGGGGDFMSRRLSELTPALQDTTEKAGKANTSMDGLNKTLILGKVASNTAQKGLSSLVGFMGGPVGIIITAITTVIGSYLEQQAKIKGQAGEIKGALESIADAYAQGGNTAVSSLARTNKAVQDNLAALQQYGVTAQTIFNASQGNPQAQGDVINRLQQQRTDLDKELSDIKDKGSFYGWLFGGGNKASDRGGEIFDRINAIDKLIPDLKKQYEAQKALAEAEAEAIRTGALLRGQLETVTIALDGATPTAKQFEVALRSVGDMSVDSGTKMDVYRALADKLADSTMAASDKAGLFRTILSQIGSTVETHGPTFDALTGVFNNIADSALNANDKTSLLKQTMDQMYQASISQIEADERMARTQADLSVQLAQSSLGFDYKTAATEADKDAILRNRDALEAALQSTRDSFIANIANGDSLELARQKHEDQITAIRTEIPETQRNSVAVEELITKYGAIPGAVQTEYKTSGVEKIYQELVNLQLAQRALQEGISPAEAEKKYRSVYDSTYKRPEHGRAQAQLNADGGYISGPGGPRDDLIPAWLSNGEYVIPARVVSMFGIGFFDQLLGRGDAAGFAGGGRVSVGPPHVGGTSQSQVSEVWPFIMNALMTKVPTMDEIRKNASGGQLGAGTGPGGWQWQINVLRAAFPGLELYSAFRPGDMAESGLSYHAKGRAVDVPPRMDVFNWIKGSYGANTPELIFSPAGPRQVWNGREHTFTGDALVAAHYNHVHWAYANGGLAGRDGRPMVFDDGGRLQPGLGSYLNTTGKPENVLTDQQWDAVFDLAGRQGSAQQGNNYHFQFRDTTLDPGKLRAIEDRQAALARVGRAR